jgi:hypothetical protein
MLDGATPRVPGDVGHPESYRVAVDFAVAHGASTQQIFDGREDQMLPDLLLAGRALIQRGARAIGTTCGLLTRLQQPLASQLGVPVAVSAMLQLPTALATIDANQRIGLVTAKASLITQPRLIAAGVPIDQLDRIRLIDLAQAPNFYQALANGSAMLDVRQAGAEITRTVQRVLAAEPSIAAIVSECANLPPYSPALREATGKPVWDALGQLSWLWSAVTGCPEPAAAIEHYVSEGAE